MAVSALRHLDADERALLRRRIQEGQFRDELAFEEFAVRSAIARIKWDELRALRRLKPPRPLTDERIIRESRGARRAVARKYES